MPAPTPASPSTRPRLVLVPAATVADWVNWTSTVNSVNALPSSVLLVWPAVTAVSLRASYSTGEFAVWPGGVAIWAPVSLTLPSPGFQVRLPAALEPSSSIVYSLLDEGYVGLGTKSLAAGSSTTLCGAAGMLIVSPGTSRTPPLPGASRRSPGGAWKIAGLAARSACGVTP